jgi:hypothetical protein
MSPDINILVSNKRRNFLSEALFFPSKNGEQYERTANKIVCSFYFVQDLLQKRDTLSAYWVRLVSCFARLIHIFLLLSNAFYCPNIGTNDDRVL